MKCTENSKHTHHWEWWSFSYLL